MLPSILVHSFPLVSSLDNPILTNTSSALLRPQTLLTVMMNILLNLKPTNHTWDPTEMFLIFPSLPLQELPECPCPWPVPSLYITW